jgi:hypothetical protein
MRIDLPDFLCATGLVRLERPVEEPSVVEVQQQLALLSTGGSGGGVRVSAHERQLLTESRRATPEPGPVISQNLFSVIGHGFAKVCACASVSLVSFSFCGPWHPWLPGPHLR